MLGFDGHPAWPRRMIMATDLAGRNRRLVLADGHPTAQGRGDQAWPRRGVATEERGWPLLDLAGQGSMATRPRRWVCGHSEPGHGQWPFVCGEWPTGGRRRLWRHDLATATANTSTEPISH